MQKITTKAGPEANRETYLHSNSARLILFGYAGKELIMDPMTDPRAGLVQAKCETEAKQGEIPSETVRLSERIAELHTRILELSDRLQDVLRAPEPSDENAKCGVNPHSPLTNRLASFSDAVEHDIAMVNDIHNRLEL